MRTNMQKPSKRKYYARYLASYTKRNYALLGLGLLFVIGIALGALLIRSAGEETMDFLRQLSTGFVEQRMEQSFGENLFSVLGSSLGFLAVLFFCGFCAIAHPVELAVPLFRGLGYGFSVSSLYAYYGVGAVKFVSIFILPNMVFSSVAILFCCRESWRLSGSFFSCARGGSREELYPLRLYMARYFAAVLACAASAVIEAGMYALFAKYVVLG